MSYFGAIRNISNACKGEGQLSAFAFLKDYLVCRKKYRMGSGQYVKEKFWALSEEEKKERGTFYLNWAMWIQDFYRVRRFLCKWMSPRWSCSGKRRSRRTKAYTDFYHMGTQCFVDNGVEISRNHNLDGTLRVGNHVNFAQNVYLDYSGDVVIEDHVVFADGVHILTHDHRFQHEAKTKYDFENDAIKGNLEICYGAMIGTKAIITPTCHRIGKFSRIGAGAVVTHDVPDYAVAAGVPAKVIRYLDQ